MKMWVRITSFSGLSLSIPGGGSGTQTTPELGKFEIHTSHDICFSKVEVSSSIIFNGESFGFSYLCTEHLFQLGTVTFLFCCPLFFVFLLQEVLRIPPLAPKQGVSSLYAIGFTRNKFKMTNNSKDL